MPGLRKIVRIIVLTVMLAGIMGCYTIGCQCTIEVRNNTPYYLHLLGPGESHIYVPPGGLKLIGPDGDKSEFTILIAPGQEKTGQLIVPIDCGPDSCRFIDIQWENPSMLVVRSRCPPGPDASMDAGG